MEYEKIEQALKCLTNHSDMEKCKNKECEFYRCGCDKDDIAEEALNYIDYLKAELQHAELHLNAWEKNFHTAEERIRKETAKELLDKLKTQKHTVGELSYQQQLDDEDEIVCWWGIENDLEKIIKENK